MVEPLQFAVAPKRRIAEKNQFTFYLFPLIRSGISQHLFWCVNILSDDFSFSTVKKICALKDRNLALHGYEIAAYSDQSILIIRYFPLIFALKTVIVSNCIDKM